MHTTTKRRRSRLGSWAIAIALGTMALMGGTAALAAPLDPGDTVHVGGKVGYGGSGLFTIWDEAQANGEPAYFGYCIEHDVAAKTGLDGLVGDVSSFVGSNHFVDQAVQGKVLWVLNHSYPALSLEAFGAAAGAPGISQNDAIEATQYAIWRYTDLGWDAGWSWSSNASETAYWYLVNGANAAPPVAPTDLAVTASITGPSGEQRAGTIVGPFVVQTNQATAAVTSTLQVPITDALGNVIDPAAISNGQHLYLDLRGLSTAGSITLTVNATGAGITGRIISVPNTPGGTPTPTDHAQSIILVAPSTAKATQSATITWAAPQSTATPTIRTSLVDATDGDRTLAWDGGTVIDTVSYAGLTPGRAYTLRGELMRKSDGSATGVTTQLTFTPTAPDGSVDVSFVVPAGYAGESLVAFERLFVDTDLSGTPVAVHEDLADAAQTVTVSAKPTGPTKPHTEPKPSTEPKPTTQPVRHQQASQLANTGSVPPLWLAGGALLSLAAGAAALAARRRA